MFLLKGLMFSLLAVTVAFVHLTELAEANDLMRQEFTPQCGRCEHANTTCRRGCEIMCHIDLRHEDSNQRCTLDYACRCNLNLCRNNLNTGVGCSTMTPVQCYTQLNKEHCIQVPYPPQKRMLDDYQDDANEDY